MTREVWLQECRSRSMSGGWGRWCVVCYLSTSKDVARSWCKQSDQFCQYRAVRYVPALSKPKPAKKRDRR